jgi:hypothetical protein
MMSGNPKNDWVEVSNMWMGRTWDWLSGSGFGI